MKRIASFILSLALLVTSISQLAVSSLAAESPTITCTSKECNPGDTVSIEVNLSNNPGIMYLEITPTYSAELGSPSVQNGSIMSDLTKGKQYVWTADEDVSANGNLLTMTFSVDESVAPGNYTVGFIFRSAYNYAEKSVAFTVESATVTVKAKPVPVTGIALDKETASIGTGDGTLTLTPIFTPETATNKNVAWASSDTSVATVDGGVVTPLKKGTATITATTEDGNFSASCIVTVTCSHLNTTDHPAEDSTCIAHGHAAYKTCNDCGEVVEGSNAELPLGKHTGGKATCKQKAICSVCGNEYDDLAKHIYTEIVDGKYLVSAATCGSKAVYNKSCSVCGLKSDETFETGEYDYTNHIGSTYKKNQKEATCYAEGYTGDIYCSTCNHEIEKGTPIAKNAHNPASVWTTDETDHWKECQTVGCGNIIDKAHHSGGEATCVKKAICSVCKVEYGAVDPSNHKPGDWIVEKEATEDADGYRYKLCTVCSEKVAEEVLPKLAWVNPFEDVKESDWFYLSVKYANQNGLLKGTGDTTFEPNTSMNRAMFCRVLANLEGVDNENNVTVDAFSDVLSGMWYTKAVKWAAEAGIVSGYPGGVFLPTESITRQEMCLMLANYAEYLGIYEDLKAKEDNGVVFADAKAIANWASEAVTVMKNNGYIVGKPIDGAYEFQPQATATRAEVAIIFRAFCMANPVVLKK